MTRSILDDAFRHHVWSSATLLAFCEQLGQDQLGEPVPGTYGSVIDTARHLVSADCSYLHTLSGGRFGGVECEQMALGELRETMHGNGVAWSEVLAEAPDPQATVVRRRRDGSEVQAPVGIRLAQVLHHGSDHRSQICTAVSLFGLEPPAIDVWSYGLLDGRVVETAPER